MRFMAIRLSGWTFDASDARGLAGSRGRAFLRRAATAVFSQEAEQRVHRLEARGVDHRATFTANRDQTGLAQTIEVEGERVGCKREGGGDCARRHSLRAGLHEQAEH